MNELRAQLLADGALRSTNRELAKALETTAGELEERAADLREAASRLRRRAEAGERYRAEHPERVVASRQRYLGVICACGHDRGYHYDSGECFSGYCGCKGFTAGAGQTTDTAAETETATDGGER